MATERISTNINIFVNYLQSTTAELLALSPGSLTQHNWERYNWLPAELAAWQDFLRRVLLLYPAYQANPKGNPPNTKKIHGIIAETRAYDKLNHLLDRIAAGSPTIITPDDFTLFNIKHNAPAAEGSMPTTKLMSTSLMVYFIAKGIGGAIIHFMARADKAAKRGHILKGYELCIMYLILNAGDQVPTTTDKLTQTETSTRASNNLPLDASNEGKRIAMCMYWKHKNKKHLDGPKSAIQVVVIG
ncbi:MAG: hypothetical protein ACYDCN_13730 [Bacteroidia bacterium]